MRMELSRRKLLTTAGKVTLFGAALSVIKCGGPTAPTLSYYDRLSPMAEEIYKVRPYTEELTRNDRTTQDKVRRIVEWGQTNLFHYNEEYLMQDTYEVASVRETFSSINIEDIFRERAVGCHLAVFTLVTMLRSIDVDADYIRSESLCPDTNEPGHGILYIPEIERYVHGDRLIIHNVWRTESIIVDRELQISNERDEPEALEAIYGSTHSGGFLQREEGTLYIDGVVHAGFEDTEFQRLRRMFFEYNLRLTEVMPSGFGTRFVSDRVPIQTLEW